MTDYEYIMAQCRKAHYSKWDDGELRKCVDMLAGLERQELTLLYMSKWIEHEKNLKEEIFKVLFADKVGKREERIKEMEINELIAEFQDKKSGNVSLIRNELKYRYNEGRVDEKSS